MVKICEKYAADFDIKFNGSKSQLLVFGGRDCNLPQKGINVGGVELKYTDSAVHLGHMISSNKTEAIIKAGQNSFWRSFNLFISDYGHVYSFLKNKLFVQYCCSFYGAALWPHSSGEFDNLCIAWRKALRQLWRVPPHTHCNIIAALSSQPPIELSLKTRFCRFISKCLSHDNTVINFISHVAIHNPMSYIGQNYRNLHCPTGKVSMICHAYENWYNERKDIMDSVNVLHEMIDVRDGFRSCDILTTDDVNSIIYEMSVN